MADFDWEFDRRTHTVRLPDGVIALRGRQAQVFEFLFDRAGEIVSRSCLETEVWGLSAQVRSETVPVTLRKLRASLGAFGPMLLHTFRGVGWRLVSPPRAARPALPRPATPYFARTGVDAAIGALMADGWRVVTLTGPGGAGKTRTVLHFLNTYSAACTYVALGDVRTEAEGLSALLEAAGMIEGGLDSLAQALSTRPTLFALDEAEQHLPMVGRWIDALGDHRFLITSRQELARLDEAVFEMPALCGETGRQFARQMMHAARWRHAPDDATLDALLAAVDGLPLAVEVCSARPQSPTEILAALNAARPVPGFDAIADVLGRSLVDLPTDQRDLLLALSQAAGSLTTDEIVSWHGGDAATRVHALAQRSLLHQQADGWRMLHGIRRLLGEQAAAPYQRWLAVYAQRLSTEILRQSDPALDRVSALRSDLMRCIEEGPQAHLRDLVWLLLLAACHRGPLSVYRHALDRAHARAPDDPFLSALKQLDGQSVAQTSLTDPTDLLRFWTVLSLGWLPIDPALLPARPTSADGPEEAALLARLQLTARAAAEGDPIIAGAALQTRLADFPLLAFHAELTVARLLINAGRFFEAQAHLEDLQARLGPTRLDALKLTVWHGLAETAAWSAPPEAAIAAALRAHHQSIKTGWAWSWAAARPGVLLHLRGLTTQAAPMLAHGLRAPHREIRAVCDVLLTAQAVESGIQPPSALDRLDAFDLTTCMRDGTPLQAIVDGQLAWTRLCVAHAPPTAYTKLCNAPSARLLALMRHRL